MTARFSVATLALAFALAGSNPGIAQTADQTKRTIQVTGDAEVRVVPNEALVSMSVVVRDKDLLTGRNKVDGSVGKVLALLRKLGVDAEHVQTEYAEVSPEYVSCDSDQRRTVACDPTRISYYDLKKGISLRVSDLSKFETIISEALQSGVTNITNVQFVTTDMRKYQDQARDLAVRAAREKATAVAGALGQKVGKPLTISVDGNMSYLGASGRQQFGYAAAAQNVTAIGGMVIGSNFESTVSLGTTKVTAQVGVVFELE